jgi:hypothetical protein
MDAQALRLREERRGLRCRPNCNGCAKRGGARDEVGQGLRGRLSATAQG